VLWGSKDRPVIMAYLILLRRRLAGSRTAAAIYFAAVVAGLAVASTWVDGCAIASVGFIAFVVPIPFTWPLVDAAFLRYMRPPKHPPMVNAPARSRLHWVVAVLAGLLVSFLVSALAGC
jgi:hypothetical protein